MGYSVNYSLEAVDLLRRKRVQVDRFKHPAWPEVISAVQAEYSVYVNFPLKVGAGTGNATDVELKQPADWRRIEALIALTHTAHVNLHLAARASNYSGFPADTTAAAHVDMLVENSIRDVNGVVERFGAERVIVEND